MSAPVPAADAGAVAGCDAFALFRERARARDHNWDARSPADIVAATDILRLVDGIPLAIELAAAWVDSRTLAEIRTGLGNLLERRGPGTTSCHQSMRACLDYSFDLLPNDARDALPMLAVFAGGFFAEDVEAVCGMTAAGEVLLTLHERNLLTREERLGRSRYAMLATVQAYAAGKLPETVAAALRRAHARHFLGVLRVANQELGGVRYAEALGQFGINLANFEAGSSESQSSEDHEAILDYAAFLADYLRLKGRHNDYLSLALVARSAAEELGAEAVAGADNNLGIAYAGLPTGDRSDNLRRAIKCFEAALRVCTERDFPQDWAGTQKNLGLAYAELPTGDRGDNLPRAIECYEAAARGYDAVGIRDEADRARTAAQGVRDRLKKS